MESPAPSSVAGGKDPGDVVRRAAVAEAAHDYAAAPRRRRVTLPVVLFVATCLSTFWTGSVDWHPERQAGCMQRAATQFQFHWQRGESGAAVSRAAAALVPNWQRGLVYMLAVMGILLTHEMGHFLMALRYHVPASLPFFIPVPLLPFGTMGAVIGLDGLKADRREMFDLGIAGPLAGLAVALPVTCLGILQLNPAAHPGSGMPFFSPLILRLMIGWLRPDFPTPEILHMSEFNPLLMAGWVGMLVTGTEYGPAEPARRGTRGLLAVGTSSGTRARSDVGGGRHRVDLDLGGLRLDRHADAGDPDGYPPSAHGRRPRPARLAPSRVGLRLAGHPHPMLSAHADYVKRRWFGTRILNNEPNVR